MGMPMLERVPVVVVTGANAGVGFGICQRLLAQLCQLNPPDSLPQAFASGVTSEEKAPAGYEGLTLIMACRSTNRAEAARAKLLTWFDGYIEELSKGQQRTEEETEYTQQFRARCTVQTMELDLASFSSVLQFAATLRDKVPYVSHLVFNAGVASFERIDWFLCLKQFFRDPMSIITAPQYYTQYVGELSADNLGWVWQSNVFGHFVLFREIQNLDLLAKSPLKGGAKVIWSSSLEASPKSYDSDDWQLLKTGRSYESSKYQIDLIAMNLDLQAQQTGSPRHFITEPGVCSTSISAALVGPFMDSMKVLAFYVARMFGSQHHSILPFKAAIAAVHLILIPVCFIPIYLKGDSSKPVRFGAHTGRWGDERVDVTVVREWDAHKEEGATLIRQCDQLHDEMKNAELAPRESETASERM